jgi:hypothetical protein
VKCFQSTAKGEEIRKAKERIEKKREKLKEEEKKISSSYPLGNQGGKVL